jgi:hypothetical protein
MTNYLIYYLHYKDETLMIPMYSKRQDYCAFVRARTSNEAINIVLNKFATPIKVMGVALWPEHLEPPAGKGALICR